MISKTNGIVFKTIKYSDNSLIAKVYTEAHGLRSYLVRGLSGKGAAVKKSAFQQLSILELVVYEKERNNLQNVKEIVSIYPYKSLPFDMRKRCIGMFINEVMYRSIHNEEPDSRLFEFIYTALIELDNREDEVENFHLRFLTGLTKYLGFTPRNNFSKANQYFDLQEGVFVNDKPMHNNYLDQSMSLKLYYLIHKPENINALITNAADRNELLVKLLDYYRLHIPVFGEVKSHLVLKELLA
jgi:DNA repair protein RecO (recombination protein O)